MAFHPASETPISDHGTSSQRVSGAAHDLGPDVFDAVPPVIGAAQALANQPCSTPDMVDPVAGGHQERQAAEREHYATRTRPPAMRSGGEPQPEDGEVGIALDQAERAGREPAHVLGEIGAEQQLPRSPPRRAGEWRGLSPTAASPRPTD